MLNFMFFLFADLLEKNMNKIKSEQERMNSDAIDQEVAKKVDSG